jgi:hypothetical protein
MDIEGYLRRLEGSIHKSLSSQKNHGVRGRKMEERQCIQQIREKLKQLDHLLEERNSNQNDCDRFKS